MALTIESIDECWSPQASKRNGNQRRRQDRRLGTYMMEPWQSRALLHATQGAHICVCVIVYANMCLMLYGAYVKVKILNMPNPRVCFGVFVFCSTHVPNPELMSTDLN